LSTEQPPEWLANTKYPALAHTEPHIPKPRKKRGPVKRVTFPRGNRVDNTKRHVRKRDLKMPYFAVAGQITDSENEQPALEWLIENKGYKREDIHHGHTATWAKHFHTAIPDFICDDSKRYEVKTRYGKRITFSELQYETFLLTDIILVFDHGGKFVKELLWKECLPNVSVSKSCYDYVLKVV
jgi:hypothetical protein